MSQTKILNVFSVYNSENLTIIVWSVMSICQFMPRIGKIGKNNSTFLYFISSMAGILIISAVLQASNTAICLKNITNINDSWVWNVSIKLSQNVCLINIHIFMYLLVGCN